MSMIRRAVCALIVLSVLAFQSVSRAEVWESKTGQNLAGAVVADARDRLGSFVTALVTPALDIKELQCLARNIFHESANEPIEGKVAVGVVTLNRAKDSRFGDSICEVVHKRTVFRKTQEVVTQETQQRAWFRPKETVTVRSQVVKNISICQFSWTCESVRKPRADDQRWIESQEIARNLLISQDTYSDYREKYSSALYFHALHVRPVWAKQKRHVSRIGGHHFYSDRQKDL